MKAFLTAIVAIVVISAGAAWGLTMVPMSAQDVNSSSNVRLD